MLTITKQSDYAILFISKLREQKDFVSLTEFIKETKLPQRFLARIAAELVKNKIVISKEGKEGGYKLIADLKKFSLYDFLKIFEKDVAFCKCSDDDYCCDYQKICHHHNFLKNKLNLIVVQALKKYSLADIYE